MNFIVGKWYCVGWDQPDGTIQWEEFVRYEGEGCFSNEQGEPVNSTFNPETQLTVAITSADHYMPQS